MLVLFVIVILLIVIGTLLPLSKGSHWMIRGLDFPRLQIALLAGVLLAAQLLVLDLQLPLTWLLIAVTMLCFLWQLYWVVPYTLIWPNEVKDSCSTDPNRQLSIITSNVLQTNRNSAALIALVKQYQPDILVTRVKPVVEDKLEVLEASMPYSVKCPWIIYMACMCIPDYL